MMGVVKVEGRVFNSAGELVLSREAEWDGVPPPPEFSFGAHDLDALPDGDTYRFVWTLDGMELADHPLLVVADSPKFVGGNIPDDGPTNAWW